MNASTGRLVSSALILLFLIMTIGMVYVLSVETQAALKGSVQDKLMAVASVTASQIDGDAFARLGPGDEGTETFLKIRGQLRSVRDATPGVHYIYTMRKDGDAVVFVVDADYGTDADTSRIGEPYPEAEEEMLAGFSAPSADQEFTTDEWGTVLSGFAPIRDRSGAVVGIVGVDMDSTLVSRELDYLSLFFYGIGLVALVMVLFGIAVIEYRRAADAERIAESEQKYRLLFEHAADSIIIFAAEGPEPGRIIAANSVAASMHGYTTEEMLSLNIADLDTPETRSRVQERISQVLRTGSIRGEAVHVRKDGTQFPIEINGALFVLGPAKYVLAIDRDISESKAAVSALEQVTRKLNLLNAVTFNDIQNAAFTLSGYLTLCTTRTDDMTVKGSLDKSQASLQRILHSLAFAKSYQDLGVRPARWHNVNQTFILGISHMDFSRIARKVELEDLEIFADSLLERVFYALADNVLRHAGTATEVTLGYRMEGENLVLFFADNGPGVPAGEKETIFTRGYGRHKGMELFLVREILGITGITVRECGTPGSGARFEMTVPHGAFRFPHQKKDGTG